MPSSNYLINALKNPKLDTSDFLLLSIEILEMQGIKSDSIKLIKQAFLAYNYEAAKKALNDVLQNLPNNEIKQLLIDQSKICGNNDNAYENHGRRYFDTMFSIAHWKSQEQEEFSSIQKLLNLMTVEFFAQKVENYSSDYFWQLPTTVSDINAAHDVIAMIRAFEFEAKAILKVEEEIRSKSLLYPQKDRGEGEDEKADHDSLSYNPGIIKASARLNVDKRLEEPTKTLTNIFLKSSKSKKGFSNTNQHIPYVNSLSGTTYSLVAVLKYFMEAHKNDANLEKDVNNLIKAFLTFTCMKGYHSLGEMKAVLQDSEVQNILAKYKVSLKPFSDEMLTQLIKDTTQYLCDKHKADQFNKMLNAYFDKQAKKVDLDVEQMEDSKKEEREVSRNIHTLFKPPMGIWQVYLKSPEVLKTNLDGIFRDHAVELRSGNFVETLRALRRLYLDYHPDKHNNKVQPGYHELYAIIDKLRSSDGEKQAEILAILDKIESDTPDASANISI